MIFQQTPNRQSHSILLPTRNRGGRRRLGLLFATLVTACAAGITDVQAEQPITPSNPAVRFDQLTQVSVINSLMLGNYDGVAPLERVLASGNLGLGTVDRLDGELIILDGEAFHARGDGSVHRCPPGMTTPFAVVTPFEGEEEFTLPNVSRLEQLESLIDARYPSQSQFLALQLKAKFSSVWMRAVSRQERPYKPLAEVTKSQSEWKLNNVTGTIVGIRSPKWVTGIGIPGYHWHFLSDDRTAGGHVFDVKFESATVLCDQCRTWTIQLDGLEHQKHDLSQDLSKEINAVERKRATGTVQPGAENQQDK